MSAALAISSLVLATSSAACSAAPEDEPDDAAASEGAVVENKSAIRAKRVSSVADVPKQRPSAGSYRVHMIDVGTGLAILVQGADFDMLFDGGSNDDRGGISKAGNKNRLLAYLYAAIGPSGPKECVPDGDKWVSGKDQPKRKLDHVFLSHPHNDHVSMLDDVLHCYQAADVWDAGSAYPSVAYRNFVTAFAEDTTVRYHTANDVSPKERTVTIDGERVDIRGPWERMQDGAREFALDKGASFKVLHADGAYYEDANQNSIVLSVKLGARKLLLMGDAESGPRADPSAPVGFVEKFLLMKYKKELAADIMQVGHHGSKTSSRLELLKAVDPRWALVSAGPTKYSGTELPDPEVVDALRRLAPGMNVLRTDTNDGKCPTADRIGVDDDAPGGCDNWVLDITP